MNITKRTVSIPGLPVMTVQKAKDLKDKLNRAISALPPPAPPMYSGPDLKELIPEIQKLAKKMYASLTRPDSPTDGVTTQFGVSEDTHGWRISMSRNSDSTSGLKNSMVIHVRSCEEYGKNEDGETATICFPGGFAVSVLNATLEVLHLETTDVWYANFWGSARINSCPSSLIESHSRYIPFSSQTKGFKSFGSWFKSGLKNSKKEVSHD